MVQPDLAFDRRSFFKLLLLVPVYLFITLMWAILGFIVWLPIMFRNIVVASFVSVAKILKGEDIGTTIISILDSVLLYFRGFLVVFHSVFRGGATYSLAAMNNTLSVRSLPFELLMGALLIFILYALFVSGVPFIENLRVLKLNVMDILNGFNASISYVFNSK
jgi:hypothetical protein